MLASKVFFYPFYFSGFTAGFCILAAIILIYYLYRREHYGDIGCLALLLLPFLPILYLGNVIDKRWEKLIEFNTLKDKFNLPPSHTLKVMVALSCNGIWVLGIMFMSYFDSSTLVMVVWCYVVPFIFLYLYILWIKTFFVLLWRLRPQVAKAIVWLSIILIIVFWIFAIRLYIDITSIEYPMQYWENEYLSSHEKIQDVKVMTLEERNSKPKVIGYVF